MGVFRQSLMRFQATNHARAMLLFKVHFQFVQFFHDRMIHEPGGGEVEDHRTVCSDRQDLSPQSDPGTEDRRVFHRDQSGAAIGFCDFNIGRKQ